MLLTTRRARQLVLAGLATALFSAMGLASAVAAEPDHVDGVSEAASLSRAEAPLPGRDSTLPGFALGLLAGSSGLAWVVRRSTPPPPAGRGQAEHSRS